MSAKVLMEYLVVNHVLSLKRFLRSKFLESLAGSGRAPVTRISFFPLKNMWDVLLGNFHQALTYTT